MTQVLAWLVVLGMGALIASMLRSDFGHIQCRYCMVADAQYAAIGQITGRLMLVALGHYREHIRYIYALDDNLNVINQSHTDADEREAANLSAVIADAQYDERVTELRIYDLDALTRITLWSREGG